jgi:adenine-specific DNA-methyltransferase
MTRSQKLELTWVGKDERPRLEPRILVEDSALSYHAAARVTPNDRFDNLLIQGDNLLALKALEQEYAGKAKCVFIDPPYNTGSAFEHYDDGVEHSLWLSLMRDRLELLRSLLSEEGTLWVSISDHEQAYLKVLLDEVFGRSSFLASIVWERTTSARNDAEFFSVDQDYVLVYAKSRAHVRINRLSRTGAAEAAYANPDDDPRGPWREGDYKCAKSADERPNLYYPISHPRTGEDVWPRRERVWAYGKEEHARHQREGLLWWGKTQNYRLPKLKRFRADAPPELVPRTLWRADEVSQTRTARKEMKDLFPENPFSTPKPEALMERVIRLATNPGDLVLDSFLGSGTTAAVAHKMGRRWIGIELGDHAVTHCVPRLRKVIDGADLGGVTEQMNWKGGGGFRFLRLASSLLERDHWGNWVVSREYNAAMLAEAVCKLEGFRYEPNPQVFWQQGKSSEQDYLYVTTQTLDARQLEWLSESVGPDRTLKVLCRAWLGSEESWSNLTLKKIPNAVLGRCEFGRDNYSLRIASLPDAPESVSNGADAASEPSAEEPVTRTRARRSSSARSRSSASNDTQTDLLSGSDA